MTAVPEPFKNLEFEVQGYESALADDLRIHQKTGGTPQGFEWCQLALTIRKEQIRLLLRALEENGPSRTADLVEREHQ
jgi:hypothetical protein